MESTSPPMRLTRRTLLQIIRRAPRPQEIVDNPIDWATLAVGIIKQQLAQQLIDGIQYQKVDDWFTMEIFPPEIPGYTEHIVPVQHALYDGVVVDSEVERAFALAIDKMEHIRHFVKLPNKFVVETPIGSYNPDWAVVMDNPDGETSSDGAARPLLYLIIETKGGTDLAKLRFAHEVQKIHCGCVHFRGALGIPYEVAAQASGLPDAATIGVEKGC
jgi:type III restriction enzyme